MSTAENTNKNNRGTSLGRLQTNGDDFAFHGLNQQEPESWEDGQGSQLSQFGEYEWWYFDAHLPNGMPAVVTFHFLVDVHGHVIPEIFLNILQGEKMIADQQM